MKIKKNRLLIQLKYSDLLPDGGNLGKYFFGFGWELYLGHENIKTYKPEIINRIKSIAEKKQIPLRLHAPIIEIDYSRTQDPSPMIKSAYRSLPRFCKLMNIDSVVAHADFDYKSDFSVGRQFENALPFWRGIAGDLNAESIKLNIENHFETFPDRLIMLMKQISLPNLGMCVDLGHYNAFSDLGTKKWLAGYPRGSIKEIHLADNAGDADTHLPLGEGNIDFALFFEIFARRGEDCVFVLEPRSLDEIGTSLSFLEKGGYIE